MSAVQASDHLLPGFNNGVLDSQAVFRVALEAMARPGSVHSIPVKLPNPDGMNVATAALALTLLDADTRVWLSPGLCQSAIVAYLNFHAGPAQVNDIGMADFVLIGEGDALPSLDDLHIGDPEYPDSSATLIVTLPSLDGGASQTLKGPGIKSTQQFAPAGLNDRFWSDWERNNMLFPQGVDIFFTSGNELAAMPRTTQRG